MPLLCLPKKVAIKIRRMGSGHFMAWEKFQAKGFQEKISRTVFLDLILQCSGNSTQKRMSTVLNFWTSS
jgi:hypothetical protein